MKIAVRYQSMTGNTRKVAKAIGEALGVAAEPLSAALDGPVDLLFVGGGRYGGQADKALRAFLDALRPEAVKTVAVFGTAMRGDGILAEVTEALDGRGIAVAPQAFHCHGRFLFFFLGRPNEADLAEAARFAKETAQRTGQLG